MNTNIPAAVVAVVLTCGCTGVTHNTYHPNGKLQSHTSYHSLGVKRSVDRLKFGTLEIEGLKSDEAKGLESAAKGAVQGITGSPSVMSSPAISNDFLNLVQPVYQPPKWSWDDKTESFLIVK